MENNSNDFSKYQNDFSKYDHYNMNRNSFVSDAQDNNNKINEEYLINLEGLIKGK